MKCVLILLFLIIGISGDCPSLYGNYFSSSEYTSLSNVITGFKINVTCPSLATGVNYETHNGHLIDVGLYTDNNNHPGVLVAKATSPYHNDNYITANFSSTIYLSQGIYWLFIPTGANIIITGASDGSIGVFETSLVDNLTESTTAPFDILIDVWMNVESVGTTCQGDWDCISSEANWGFATCQNGYCVCSENFSGFATPDSPCTCEKVLAWDQNGNPYCLNDGVCEVGDSVRVDLCSDYTENFKFIQCNNGQCQCLDGFQGSATSTDQCRCDNTLSWDNNGNPTCSPDSTS